MTQAFRSLAFIGAGNMSRSIISGLVNNGYPPTQITASNPSTGKLDALAADYNIHTTSDNLAAIAQAEVVILGVKPQLMAEVCAPIAKLDLSGKLVISIAAGVTAERLSQYLGGHQALIRTMPNTPSMLGYGMTGLFANPQVGESDRQFAGQLMAAVGEILWVEHEAQIDNVIACAGSSPAYFFLFMEAMMAGAAKLGVTPEDARKMIEHSALGAAQMVIHNPDLSISELRAQVTSKGGATYEAIQTFEQQGMPQSVQDAMQAAVTRAQQMANLF